MPAKKYATWVAVAFVAFYVFQQPEGAAKSVHNVADGLASAAGSVATFVNAIGA
ncbi:hypothetical protein [Spirillospora sp. CA-294931]|uniref:hypothetical protein n=1 Tax=Spirillospora sp. CA-294931 TaxID=3240042 RepID=UPI003D932709